VLHNDNHQSSVVALAPIMASSNRCLFVILLTNSIVHLSFDVHFCKKTFNLPSCLGHLVLSFTDVGYLIMQLMFSHVLLG